MKHERATPEGMTRLQGAERLLQCSPSTVRGRVFPSQKHGLGWYPSRNLTRFPFGVALPEVAGRLLGRQQSPPTLTEPEGVRKGFKRSDFDAFERFAVHHPLRNRRTESGKLRELAGVLDAFGVHEWTNVPTLHVANVACNAGVAKRRALAYIPSVPFQDV